MASQLSTEQEMLDIIVKNLMVLGTLLYRGGSVLKDKLVTLVGSDMDVDGSVDLMTVLAILPSTWQKALHGDEKAKQCLHEVMMLLK